MAAGLDLPIKIIQFEISLKMSQHCFSSNPEFLLKKNGEIIHLDPFASDFLLPNVGRPLNRGIPGQWMVHDLIVGFKSSQVSSKNHGKILKKSTKKTFGRRR